MILRQVQLRIGKAERDSDTSTPRVVPTIESVLRMRITDMRTAMNLNNYT